MTEVTVVNVSPVTKAPAARGRAVPRHPRTRRTVGRGRIVTRKRGSPAPKTTRRRPTRPAADVAAAERLLAAAKAGADVRARKVRRLKAAIKTRAYENDLKLMVAVERLLATAGTVVDLEAGRTPDP